MNKLYIEGNYLIIEDTRVGTVVSNFVIKQSTYSLVDDPAGYIINTVGRDGIVILTADIGTWFDEAGVVPFTEATLIAFLRLNTGF
jgi:hypothetical protein